MGEVEKKLTKSKLHNNSDTESTSSIPTNILIHLASGALAGATAKTFIAPLDRTKINFQINKQIKYTFKNALGFIKRTYRKEGFLALYRGNTATLARIIPYSACQFASFEQFRKLLKVDESPDPHVRRFLAGSLAGVTSQSVTYPLDLARARMAITNKCGYKNFWEVFTLIYTKENNIKALYRGYLPTVLGVIPYAGTSFFTYETLKQKHFEMTGEKKTSAIHSLLFGACAGICGQTSSYPLDIVRRRMQTSGENGCDSYLTIRHTVRKVYTEEGLRSFFKGLSMNWIKGPLAVGISFSSYDTIKHFLSSIHYGS